jgi:hypothetical protein
MYRTLVSALALIAICAPAQATEAAAITDISAAQRRTISVSRAPVARPVVRRVTVQRSVSRRVVSQPRVSTRRVGVVKSPAGVPKSLKKVGGPISPKINPAIVQPKLGFGPGKINPSPKAGNFQFVKLPGNKVAPIMKGQKMLWIGGKWKKFLPLSAIGVVLLGGAYYYPDAYLSVGRPYCEGITPDGCRLNWQMVGFDDGGGEWQCVQYCQRPGAMPPPQTVAFAAPPPVPQGRCEITIYSEPNFASNAVPTGEDQPQLSLSGWQDQIASIQVKSGTWEVFTEEQYAGNAMRLSPGSYPTLAPEWTKRINSLQCIQPGN